MKEKIVVTGGAGFIGSHLVDALINRKYEVHVVDNHMAKRREDRINPNATYHQVDIRNYDELEPIIKSASYVFHEAALPSVQYSIDHPLETFSVNVHGTENVLQAAHEAGVKRVIFASTCAAYGDQETMPFTEDMTPNPKSPYGLHKYMGECMCRLRSKIYQLPTVSLRYLNVYGPRFNLRGAYTAALGKFILLKSEGKPLTIFGDGSHTRDFVHVSDAVHANLAAMESEKVGNGEVINIGTGRSISVNELAEIIEGPVAHEPERLEPAQVAAEVRRAKELLDWEPKITLEEGIAELKKLHKIT